MPDFRDPQLDPHTRAQALLSHLSVEEKFAQLGGWIMPYAQPPGTVVEGQARVNPEIQERLRLGLGAISYVNLGLDIAQGVLWSNALQKAALEGSRWGIPLFLCEECAWGHFAYEATAYPLPANLAASFDPGLVEAVFRQVGAEVRTRGGNLVHSPVADLARDPRWGRSNESFSEDTHLAGAMVAAAVRGLQGGAGGVRPGAVAASVKHFAGFAQSDGGRQMAPVNLGRSAFLNEILPPFREAVRAGVEAVMPTYPEIDGVPCHRNAWLLTEILRGHWGFSGLTVADYGGVDKLYHAQHTAADAREASLQALQAGVDMDLPSGENYPSLTATYASDAAVRARVDEAVLRVLTLKFKLGLFENPFTTHAQAQATVGQASHRALALEAGIAGSVLLKNERALLPFDPARPPRLALIGPHARLPHLGDDRPGRVTLEEGLRAQLPAGTPLLWAQGCNLTTKDHADSTYLAETAGQSLTQLQAADVNPEIARLYADALPRLLPLTAEQALIDEAVAVARQAEVAILCLGDSQHCTGENYSPTRRCDRDTIDLPGNQAALLRAVAATGVPIVVLLVHGRSLALGDIEPNAQALLDLWNPGEARGTVAARILFGLDEPRGRLPFSLPLQSGSLPCHYSQRPLGTARAYAFREATLAYPFGHGLGYTHFSLSTPETEPQLTAGAAHTVSLTVRNTGDRAGSTVVQAYLQDLVSLWTRPERQLCAWQRVSLAPGESTCVRLEIPAEAFSYLTPEGQTVLEPGEFRIGLGLDSQNLQWVSCRLA